MVRGCALARMRRRKTGLGRPRVWRVQTAEAEGEAEDGGEGTGAPAMVLSASLSSSAAEACSRGVRMLRQGSAARRGLRRSPEIPNADLRGLGDGAEIQDPLQLPVRAFVTAATTPSDRNPKRLLARPIALIKLTSRAAVLPSTLLVLVLVCQTCTAGLGAPSACLAAVLQHCFPTNVRRHTLGNWEISYSGHSATPPTFHHLLRHDDTLALWPCGPWLLCGI